MTSRPDLKRNPTWVKQMEEYFDSVDLNKNGFLTIEEILKWAEKMRVLCKATPQEIKNLEAGLREFWGTVGLVPGKRLNKRQFVRGVSQLGRSELEKKSRNEKTLHEKLSNAFFDVMDINNDGTVSLEELRTILIATDMDPSGAEPWFNMADANENGKVERSELIKSEFDFWFRPEDPSTKGMFGGAYESGK